MSFEPPENVKNPTFYRIVIDYDYDVRIEKFISDNDGNDSEHYGYNNYWKHRLITKKLFYDRPDFLPPDNCGKAFAEFWLHRQFSKHGHKLIKDLQRAIVDYFEDDDSMNDENLKNNLDDVSDD